MAVAAGAVVLVVLTGTGEAVGVGFAEAVTAGVGVTTAGGLVVVWAFTQGINAQRATRKLPKEKTQDFIGLREREASLGFRDAHQRDGLIIV